MFKCLPPFQCVRIWQYFGVEIVIPKTEVWNMVDEYGKQAKHAIFANIGILHLAATATIKCFQFTRWRSTTPNIFLNKLVKKIHSGTLESLLIFTTQFHIDTSHSHDISDIVLLSSFVLHLHSIEFVLCNCRNDVIGRVTKFNFTFYISLCLSRREETG